MYLVHLQDYDLDTVHQITRAPKDLIVRWARDSGTIKPAAMHNGEGVCHYFHMTANGSWRGADLHHDGEHRQIRDGLPYLVRQLQSRRIWNATPWSGAGLAVHTGEDPFNLTLDPNAHGKEIKTKSYYYGEDVGLSGTTAIRP